MTAEEALEGIAKILQEYRQSKPASAGKRPFITKSEFGTLTLPHGTRLEKEYLGKVLKAQIDDGAIVWNGKRFDSLSPAAVASGRSINPDCNAPNGFLWWNVEIDGKWLPVGQLRK